FFHMPVDNVYCTNLIINDIRQQNYKNIVVVSPDVGGVVRARAVAKELDDADLAIIDKRRPQPNQAEVMNIIGEVQNRTCILVDDIVDTAGTLSTAVQALLKKGAEKVVAYCIHPVLSGRAIENLQESNIHELVVTDTIPLGKAASEAPFIRQ